MNYATVEELRTYLPQIAAGAAKDGGLLVILERATSIIDMVLGFSFAAYPDVPSAQTLYGDGTSFLSLPPLDTASTIAVASDGVTFTGYDVRRIRRRVALYWAWGWPMAAITVTAKWGYGLPPPAVVEVCLELAVNLWRSKDKGLFTDVIGVDTGGGAIVGYMGALTNQQKMILQGVISQYTEVGI